MIQRYCNVLLFFTAIQNTGQLYSRSSPVWPVQVLTMLALQPLVPPLPLRKRPLLHNLCTAIRYMRREIFRDVGDSFQCHTACQLLIPKDQCPFSATLCSSSFEPRRQFSIVISHELISIATVYAKMVAINLKSGFLGYEVIHNSTIL